MWRVDGYRQPVNPNLLEASDTLVCWNLTCLAQNLGNLVNDPRSSGQNHWIGGSCARAPEPVDFCVKIATLCRNLFASFSWPNGSHNSCYTLGNDGRESAEVLKIGAAPMHDIAKTAMMFVNQANKYSDCQVFETTEAFEVLFAAIETFDGAHLQSAKTRRHFFEAVNVALSTIPGNRLSVRCVEHLGGAYAIEWLPYVKERPMTAEKPERGGRSTHR
jgi:hypothetical protein